MISGQTSLALFPVGTLVRVRHPHFPPFEGVVLANADAGDDIEYRVSNAPEIVPGLPVLFWQSEVEAV